MPYKSVFGGIKNGPLIIISKTFTCQGFLRRFHDFKAQAIPKKLAIRNIRLESL
jgi:hypothetical protein